MTRTAEFSTVEFATVELSAAELTVAELLGKAPLSEYDVALLYDIGERTAADFAADADIEQLCRLKRLSEAGLIRRTDEEARIYALTGKGQRLLSERGAV